ncbi:unnamed protein product [Parascedosporium putredinis]|uniref:Uncharacterized protein n=1 Tax=Parascedosporium putredinis TaxID=1442378 RepID=A0A9P1H848_9PEZI|nr:unnamed protein product [Parascedosporium putredinis]CAI7998984.1 unnamed protein product [Parascedosporium putredinis]
MCASSNEMLHPSLTPKYKYGSGQVPVEPAPHCQVFWWCLGQLMQPPVPPTPRAACSFDVPQTRPGTWRTSAPLQRAQRLAHSTSGRLLLARPQIALPTSTKNLPWQPTGNQQPKIQSRTIRQRQGLVVLGCTETVRWIFGN